MFAKPPPTSILVGLEIFTHNLNLLVSYEILASRGGNNLGQFRAWLASAFSMEITEFLPLTIYLRKYRQSFSSVLFPTVFLITNDFTTVPKLQILIAPEKSQVTLFPPKTYYFPDPK